MIERQEIELAVNDLQMSLVRWRPKNAAVTQRVLCIHGWLDNAGSFELLASALAAQGYELVAPDLAGCGRTSHRSLHGYYNLWDDLIDIEFVVEQLGWESYVAMGHSRGAGVAALYASTSPVGMRALILLDGVVPPAYPEETLPEQLRAFIEERKVALQRNLRQSGPGASRGALNSLEEAWEKRRRLCNLDFEDMRPLLERALKPAEIDGKWQWSHDQRLNSRSIYRLAAADKEAMLAALRLPVLLLIAEEGRINAVDQTAMQSLLDHAPNLTTKFHAGDHHFHMESSRIDSVSSVIMTWLSN